MTWLSRLFQRRRESISPPDWEIAAAARGQRPVFADWVGVYTIDSAGRSYFAERVDLADQFVISDERERNMVRWRAAERYPDMANMRPQRTAADTTCPHCHGTGHPPIPDEAQRNKIWCYCGGVGWLPAGYVDLRDEHDA